mgnify:CR=1 FL=1
MKIKKIEIHGFKSFVDKVNLIFPKGVTAIVGPNGCGKSNIVDAIRWVLGEQNARHLRGKIMEDIIFNGSESRKPIGMSEVVLTLSNEEGIAPAEYVNFTEIEIARRLYRSGESEYYINKVQSRLKDIVDLFTDTGIGTRAYSIIEQGQVGWLVNAKPEERRVLFEEAAGINKFKHRKDAALRRLEATKQNLVRLNDIISEVKRQMNSLNRQAKKAEKYKAMREELKGFELFLASLEHKVLKQKRLEAEKKLEEFRQKDILLSTALSQKESNLEEVKVRHIKEESALKEIRQKTFLLDSQIKDREKALQAKEMRAGELRRNEERLINEIEGLSVQQNTVKQETMGLMRLLTEIQAAVEGEEARLLNEEDILKDVEKRGQERGAKAHELRKKKEELSNRITQTRNNIAALLTDEERLSLSIGKALREQEELEKTSQGSEANCQELMRQKGELEKKKQDVEKTGELTSEQLKELEAKIIQKENALNGMKEEFTHTSSRLHTLKELEKNFEGLHEGVRAIMLNKREGDSEYNHIHGLVADVIETSSQHEKAVETVLGERLQYIIVESQTEGVEAVEYLKTQAKGRGSFVPLKEVRMKEKGVSDPYPGAQELINQVRIKDGYYPIARYLLGDVFLVNNLNDAVLLWKSNGIDKTFVTLDGEMIDQQGVITGGYSNGKDAGILQKRREIKDLSLSVSLLEKRIAETENETKGLKHEAEASHKNLDGLKKDSHSKEIELVNIEAELKREEAEISRLKQRLEVLETEVGDARKEQETAAAKKAYFLKDRESIEIELKETENALQAVTDEVSNLYRRKDELSMVVTDIKVKLASSRERRGGVKGQIEDKEKFLVDVNNRVKQKQADIEMGIREITEEEAGAAGIKTELEDALKAMDDIRRQEIRQQEMLNQTTDEAHQIEEALNAVKKDITKLQDAVSSVSLSLKEMELNLSHLVEKMAEKYNVAIDSYSPPEEMELVEKETMTVRMDELRTEIAGLGEVSLGAIEEYRELETRHQFLLDQQADLNNSVETLHKAINRINRTTRQLFRETFDAINLKFQEVFPKFFQGGKAELRLVDEGDLLESGIEIVAQPPGKRLQSISLLSGGEKALTATSLIFSIFLIKPSPFCLLDEVDAPLDDANINRFNGFLKEMARKSQFILITHNKGTMEIADTLFGVTMEEAGVSKIVSVQLN